jgi:hypothetical protein
MAVMSDAGSPVVPVQAAVKVAAAAGVTWTVTATAQNVAISALRAPMPFLDRPSIFRIRE